MKSTSVHAVVFCGVTPTIVRVEAAVRPGLPGISIFGLAGESTRQVTDRLRCAIKAQGFAISRQHVTISISGATSFATYGQLDLAIAVVLLLLQEDIAINNVSDVILFGGISLEGGLNAPIGVYGAYIQADRLGKVLVAGPTDHLPCNAAYCCIESLGDLAHTTSFMVNRSGDSKISEKPVVTSVDFAEILGQESAKQALMIASLGRHHVILGGAVGSGKTLLGHAYESLLSPLKDNEVLEAAYLRELDERHAVSLDSKRPFIAPRQVFTKSTLFGNTKRFGDLTRAHKGTLFIDEAATLSKSLLNAFVKPLEEKTFGANGGLFPADTQVILALNPCPCGNLGSPKEACACNKTAIARHQASFTSALKDRFDMAVHVGIPDAACVIKRQSGLSTKQMQEQLEQARLFRTSRELEQQFYPHWMFGETSYGLSIRSTPTLSGKAKKRLESAADTLRLSARRIHSLMCVARSIADLELSDEVSEGHVLQALSLRP